PESSRCAGGRRLRSARGLQAASHPAAVPLERLVLRSAGRDTDRFVLADEFRVGHGFGFDQLNQRVTKQELVAPVVEPELEFVQVAVEMLRAHLVERTDDRSLEQTPDTLDAVRVNVAADPFLGAVI